MIGRTATGYYRNPRRNKHRMTPPVSNAPSAELPAPPEFLEVTGEIVGTGFDHQGHLNVYLLDDAGNIRACGYDRVIVAPKKLPGLAYKKPEPTAMPGEGEPRQ